MKLTLHRATLLLLLAASATVLAAAPHFFGGPALAPRTQHRDIIIRERHGNQVTSSNWGGYVVTGANDSVTDAAGSWLVPLLNCGSTPNAYSAFWVGIDGWGSNTVEQIGTESDCVNGQPSHYAWFEFYPHNYFAIESVPISEGDPISASVQYSGGKFVVSLTDEKTNQQFSTSTKLNQARRSSAEWIIEAPYSGGVLPLADFNNALFGVDNTGVINTNNASIAKATGPIGSFNPADVLAITMTADNGAIKAQPSPLSTDKTSFTDMWMNAGP